MRDQVERDDYALDLIAHDLGNSKNSRLYRRLVVKDRLVTEVSVMNEVRQDPGGFFVMCELHPGVAPERVEQAIREEVAGMIREGVAAADLRRIRTQIEASFLFQDETVLDLAMKLARFEAGTPDGFRTLADVLPTYESMTRKELREVAAKYFSFDRATIAVAVPATPAAAHAPRRASKKSAARKGAAKKATAKKRSKKAAGKATKASAKKAPKKSPRKAKAARRKS